MKHGWMMFLLMVPVLMSGIGSDSGNPAGRDLRTWRLHEVIYQIYDFDSGTSLNDKRFTVYYNQPDDIRIDSMAVDVWDNFLQIWIPDVITSYHYDQTGEYILRADVCYAGNPVPITQRFCRYDNQNRLKEVLSYGYNSTSQSYDLRGEITLTMTTAMWSVTSMFCTLPSPSTPGTPIRTMHPAGTYHMRWIPRPIR
jgi:hypothetical protein